MFGKYFRLLLAIIFSLIISVEHVIAQEARLSVLAYSRSTEEDNFLVNLIEQFQAVYPEIQVDLTFVPSQEYGPTLQTRIAAGEADVMALTVPNFSALVRQGVLYPGNDWLENPDDFYPALRQVFTVDGQQYCVPYSFTSLTLQYNAGYFDQQGLGYPTNEWTWDDLKSTATTFSGNGITGIVFSPNLYHYLPFLFQAGGGLFPQQSENWIFNDQFSEEFTVNYSGEGEEPPRDSPISRSLDYYVARVLEGAANSEERMGYNSPTDAFLSGAAAMVMEGTWILPSLLNSGLSWGAVQLPADTQGGDGTIAFADCFGVSAFTSYPTEAWTLVSYLTNTESQLAYGGQGFVGMPARSSAGGNWIEAWNAKFGYDISQALANFLDSAYSATVYQLPLFGEEFEANFAEGLRQAFDGNPDYVIQGVGQQSDLVLVSLPNDFRLAESSRAIWGAVIGCNYRPKPRYCR